MKDTISQGRILELNPYRTVQQTFSNFIDECEKICNSTIRIMEPVFRSSEEQDELYAQGRTKPGNIVTRAKGGTSYHNYGLAIDICTLENGKPDFGAMNARFEKIAESYGLEWGGNWTHKDLPHFELRMEFKEDCSDLILLPKDENGYVILS